MLRINDYLTLVQLALHKLLQNHILSFCYISSLEREEAEDLIKRHGGRVTGSISKKTVISLFYSFVCLNVMLLPSAMNVTNTAKSSFSELSLM